jgi:large repetitive protein
MKSANTNVVLDAEIESVAFDQNGGFLVGIEIEFVNKTIGEVVSYFWDFGDGNSSSETNPRHTYQAGGEYEITLQAIDKFGCILEWKEKIKVVDYFLVVPNVFSPNGDGVNDYFFPKFVNVESLEFWVLNKWGESLFHTTDINSRGWDGKIRGETAMPGNYVYKLQYKTVDGRVETKTEVFLLLK